MGSTSIVPYIPKSGDSKLMTFIKMSKIADAKKVRLSVIFDGVKTIVLPKDQLESGVPIGHEERGEHFYKLYRKAIKSRQNITRTLNNNYRSF